MALVPTTNEIFNKEKFFFFAKIAQNVLRSEKRVIIFFCRTDHIDGHEWLNLREITRQFTSKTSF